MPLHPATQQIIRNVEELSGRPVHVTEDPELKLLATISIARRGAPAHFLRYRPNTRAVDYLIAYQLGFLVRLFSCPSEERWEVMSNPLEQQRGIDAMELDTFPKEFAQATLDNIVTQLRTYSVGARVDNWIWMNLPELRTQQQQAIRSQLEENGKALAPEIRQNFPKPLIDANSVMNAAFAMTWADLLGEPQFVVPFKALGYAGKAKELLEILEDVPDDPTADRDLIERWAKCLGLSGSFHFESHSLI